MYLQLKSTIPKLETQIKCSARLSLQQRLYLYSNQAGSLGFGFGRAVSEEKSKFLVCVLSKCSVGESVMANGNCHRFAALPTIIIIRPASALSGFLYIMQEDMNV